MQQSRISTNVFLVTGAEGRTLTEVLFLHIENISVEKSQVFPVQNQAVYMSESWRNI